VSVLENTQYEASIKIEPSDSGLEITGDASVSSEKDDTVTVITATFAVDIVVLKYTRDEVLAKLYTHAASVAKSFGMYSQAMDAIEDDINDVKNGGELTPYAWLFGLGD